jgi:hypothetical protein
VRYLGAADYAIIGCYFAARNERDCGKLTALWACLMSLRWPMMIGFAVLGLYLEQSHDRLTDQTPCRLTSES